MTIFAGSLPQYFGMAVDPAQACAVRYVKGKVEGHALRREPRLDRDQQLISPLPGQGRNQHRPSLGVLPCREIADPGCRLGIQTIGLVPTSIV